MSNTCYPRAFSPHPDPRTSSARRACWLVLASVLTTSLPIAAQAPDAGPFRIGAWIQPAWEIQKWDGSRDRDGAFLRRARLDFTATLFEGAARIRVMPELGRGGTELRDAWIEVFPVDGIAMRMGQQGVPFNLQRATSGARQHFGDRSLATRRFEIAGGRDIGAVFAWRGEGGRRLAQLGIFNGEGPNRRQLGPAGPLISGRVAVGFGGPLPSGESDLARSEQPRLALGAGVLTANESGLRPRPGFAADDAADWRAGTLDADVRWQGISLSGAWYSHRVESITPGTPTVDGSGWHLSGGWVVPSRRFEIAIRRSEAEWDRSTRGHAENETSLGVTFFHREHALQTRVQVVRWRMLQGGEVERGHGLILEHQFLLGG